MSICGSCKRGFITIKIFESYDRTVIDKVTYCSNALCETNERSHLVLCEVPINQGVK